MSQPNARSAQNSGNGAAYLPKQHHGGRNNNNGETRGQTGAPRGQANAPRTNYGSRGAHTGGSRTGNNTSNAANDANAKGWQRSYQQRNSSRPRNTNRSTNNNTRYNNMRNSNAPHTTVKSVRDVAAKLAKVGNYRGAAKALLDGASTGVLREVSPQLDVVLMIRVMQQRNLYPEIAQIVKAVWADSKDQDNAMRAAILEAFPPRELVKRLVTAHYHEKACRYLAEFELRFPKNIAQHGAPRPEKAHD